jgi:hypothetical protein
VVVDFNDLGGGSQSLCDADGGGQKASALFTSNGYPLTYAQRQPGYVCRVSGVPTSDPCVNTSPASAYWGLWWSDGKNGKWTYSALGVQSLTIPAGGSVAFAWDDVDGSVQPSVTPPKQAASPSPSASASASPTRTPTPTPTTTPTRTPKPTPTPTVVTTTVAPSGSASATPTETPTPTESGSPSDSASASASASGSPSTNASAIASPPGAGDAAPTAAETAEPHSLPLWVPLAAIAALFVGAAAYVLRRRNRA